MFTVLKIYIIHAYPTKKVVAKMKRKKTPNAAKRQKVRKIGRLCNKEGGRGRKRK